MMLAKFIHYSDSLVHLNLGSLNMSYSQLEVVINRGIRKSRTLQSVHFSGIKTGIYENEYSLIKRMLCKAQQNMILMDDEVIGKIRK